MQKLKVVISGIHFPLSMMSYFIRAFQRRDDIDLWTCGPFTNNWTPWNYGMYLSPKHIYTPNLPLPMNLIGQKTSSLSVEKALPWKDEIPDLWLQVDADWRFSNKPKAKVVAHVQTDPHVLKPQYDEARKNMDVVFCMQQCYIKEGEKYLPYAYDPIIFYPQEKEKIYDACMIGLMYPQRAQLVELIRRMGFKVYTDIGKIFDENRELYNSSRIALSWSSLQDTPARVWEAFGMALPLLCNRTPDLGNFFVENDHYLGFSSLEEAGKQFAKLIADPEKASEMAWNARRKVETMGTWDMRITQILEQCKLI